MNVLIDATLETMPSQAIAISSLMHYEHQLLSCLGYAETQLPLGDLFRQQAGLTGRYVVVSPIHWQVTHNDAMIMAVGNTLDLSIDEARQWFTVFSNFQNRPCHFFRPDCWLMSAHDLPPLNAKTPQSLLQCSMMPALAALDSTLIWSRLLTECQMLLSSHALNQSRPHCPINGVWIYGGGIIDRKNVPIMVSHDHAGLKIAHLLSDQVTVIQEPYRYPEHSVVLWQSIEQLPVLERALKTKTVNWYWNNQAYRTKPKAWWRRAYEY